MANIMSLKNIRNKPSRNGFDLSQKINFTAKVGELLPVMVKEILPGDVFNIDLKTFTRTQPINTAAFARMREYYDFYFVPYDLLWNKAGTLLTQMYDNPQHAVDFNPLRNFTLKGEMPYLTTDQIITYLWTMRPGVSSSPVGDDVKTNYFGYRRDKCTCKLLEYLGYGNFFPALTADAGSSIDPFLNQEFNPFGLLAYQKIYADHYRDSQWEKISPSTFNLDWMTGTDDMQLPISDSQVGFQNTYNLFDLRYCNWQKDLFHGVLPRQQFGDTSVAMVSPTDDTLGLATLSGRGTIGSDELSISDGSIRIDTSTEGQSIGSLSILALRQAEFLQKWKEIVQTADKDYRDQIQKIWGVSGADATSELSTYLGGVSSSLDINEVVNTNITGDNGADIAGKGVGVSNGRIHFEAGNRFGLIMCIYHAIPLLDYTTDMINPAFTKVNAEDFANPVFDKVGMELLPLTSMLNPLLDQETEALRDKSPGFLGYVPRYIDYKTAVDYSIGGFKRDLSSWVIGYGNKSVIEQLGSINGAEQPGSSVDDINYTLFKVNPNSVDSIFGVNANDDISTDQFLCSTFFDIKAVRNLDVDGLPY